jgi:adenosylmethionine-8-amino-7-oxononanoate aminotransferase
MTHTASQHIPYSATAVDRLVLHFTANEENWHELPVIVSGAGTTVTDADGKEYFDGLAGLFTTQVGHGREELVQAAAEQMRQLDYYPTWSLQNAPSLALAERLSAIAPVDGPASAFFVNSGSEAVESALKVCRQFHAANGSLQRFKFIARNSAYHGTTMGALALGGLAGIKGPFEPLPEGFIHVPNTNEDPEGAAEAIRQAILAGPPENVAAVFLEPVQNTGGCFVPPEGYWRTVREICDEHGVLLVADATICAFGRLGTWFGIERFGVKPDIVTFAKGLTSGYVPMGGLLMSARVREALDREAMFLHGATYGGHPVAAAVALANVDLIERDGLLQHVLDLEDTFGALLRDVAAEHPIVQEVRGMGFFWALDLDPVWADGSELVGDDYTRLFKQELFDDLLERGLICRVDDRESPVIQFSPALIAEADDLRKLAEIVSAAIGELERKLGWDTATDGSQA